MLKLATKFAPRDAAMAIARDAGYQFAELWTDAAVLADWRVVADRCTRAPFQYAIHFPNQRPADDRALEHAVNLYRALQCRAMVIHQPLADELASELVGLDVNLHLAVENHDLSPAAFQQWAEENPGLTLDVEHLWYYTLPDASLSDVLGKVDEFLSRHRHKLLHVHLPGYTPGGPLHRPMHSSPELVRGVFSLLADAGYEGFVVGELAGTYQRPEMLAADLEQYRDWLRTRR